MRAHTHILQLCVLQDKKHVCWRLTLCCWLVTAQHFKDKVLAVYYISVFPCYPYRCFFFVFLFYILRLFKRTFFFSFYLTIDTCWILAIKSVISISIHIFDILGPFYLNQKFCFWLRGGEEGIEGAVPPTYSRGRVPCHCLKGATMGQKYPEVPTANRHWVGHFHLSAILYLHTQVGRSWSLVREQICGCILCLLICASRQSGLEFKLFGKVAKLAVDWLLLYSEYWPSSWTSSCLRFAVAGKLTLTTLAQFPAS